MYQLKEVPEDFIVEEVQDATWQATGDYLVLKVTKRGQNTEEVAQGLARLLHKKRNAVAYAGSKDRQAVTTQFFSIKCATKEQGQRLQLPQTTVESVGYLDHPLSLGALSGNRFRITVRDLEKGEKPKKMSLVPNFFGEQRFGLHNDRIGKALVRKDFLEACSLIIEAGGSQGKLVAERLEELPNDTVGALRRLPKKTLSLYVHAYQSALFNRMLESLLSSMSVEELHECGCQIPLIGFASRVPEHVAVKEIFEKVLKDEHLKPRDFVIRELPDCSSEGDVREAVVAIKDLRIGALEDDDRHVGKKKVLVEFTLPKGSYATNVIRHLFS